MENSLQQRDLTDPRLIAFKRLLGVMDELREKCPWDKKQTMESLRHLTIEETYELADAILSESMQDIKGELGDLMLHLVFYAKIASETGDFDISDVLDQICEKLIYRHPHIYGDVEATTEEEVKSNWEKLKLKEKSMTSTLSTGSTTEATVKSVLEGVPNALPALVKAIRIQDKVKGIGFDWSNRDDVFAKIQEEIAELHEALETKKVADIEEEFGDLLFSMVNYARFISINPEDALEKTNRKFKKRFGLMEEMAFQDGKQLEDMDLTAMEMYWLKAKESIRAQSVS